MSAGSQYNFRVEEKRKPEKMVRRCEWSGYNTPTMDNELVRFALVSCQLLRSGG